MSKAKQARFHLKSGETLLKKGMMDYSTTGGYNHFVPGDGYLTDRRFHFDADLSAGEFISIDIPLADIYEVKKIGVPFFTRSILLVTDRRNLRFNAFWPERWARPLRRAIAAGKTAAAEPMEDRYI